MDNENDDHRPSKQMKLDNAGISHSFLASTEPAASSNVSLSSWNNNDNSTTTNGSALLPHRTVLLADNEEEEEDDGLNTLASSKYKRKKPSTTTVSANSFLSSASSSTSSTSTSSSSSLRHPLSTSCPYLATINRSLLDFDMEKVCSVTLLSQHIYGCLVCGKFFHGRGKQTEAYTHSVENNHHVYVSLDNGKFFCLPDNYEIMDNTLSDIYYALFPVFKENDNVRLTYSKTLSTDIHGNSYLPGFMGMNNLRATDSLSTVVHALSHIPPIRDYFLYPQNYIPNSHLHIHPLILRFGELIRRLWSPVAFKSTVSPHEFINTVSESSQRKFGPGKVIQAADFLTWLLNTLHSELLNVSHQYEQYQQLTNTKGDKVNNTGKALSSSSTSKSTIITDVFQGEVEVTLLSSEYEEEKAQIAARKEKERLEKETLERRLNNTTEENEMEDIYERKTKSSSASASSSQPSNHPSHSALPHVTRTPFLFLSLDLPPAPLFKDDTGSISIPQIPIYALLSKFDGVTVTSTMKGQYRETRRYRITKLPRYLVFIIKRFNKNNFFTEKNPTIVNFPIRNLEMKPYVQPLNGNNETETTTNSSSSNDTTFIPLPDENSISTMSVAQLKALLRSFHTKSSSINDQQPQYQGIEKGELVRIVKENLQKERLYQQKLTLDNSRSTSTKYDMIANIAHDNPPDTSVTTTNSTKSSSKGSLSSGSSTRTNGINVGTSGSSSNSSGPNGGGNTNTLSSSNTESSNAVRLAAAASDPLIHGNYTIHLPHYGTDQWYELTDLTVKEIIPQLIGVSQSYITVFQRRNTKD